MLLVACGIAILGCGGGGSGTSKSTPPPATAATSPGSYTFAVTASDATNTKVTATTNLTVVVQQVGRSRPTVFMQRALL